MKQDKIESYIRENRDAFDDRVPPEGVWQGINGQLPDKSKSSSMMYWRVAAVVFFVLSLGLLFKNYQANSILNSYNNENTELANTEQYYLDMIEKQEVMLAGYVKNYPEIARDFKNDLEDLGKNYETLKSEYQNTGSEEVLGALIKNLQLQQELLGNQLRIIQNINEENENISI